MSLLTPMYATLRNRVFAVCRWLFRNTPVTLRGEFLRGVKIRGRHAFEVGEPLEERFLKRIRLQGRVVFDVGAHVGRYTAAFARATGPNGLVVAFEANPAIIVELEDTVRCNRCDNVRIINGGVGDRAGGALLVVPLDGISSASCDTAIHDMLRSRSSIEEVSIIVNTLEHYVAIHHLPPPYMIKIDVEGFEYQVLMGMQTILAQNHPSLFIEIHGADLEQKVKNVREVVALLSRHGYTMHHVEQNLAITNENAEMAREGHLWAYYRHI